MSVADFFKKPFDEGTLTKLQIFELYAEAWLPVFLARREPPCREVHVFDFFAGPGTDVEGTPGSPLRLLRKLHAAQHYAGWPNVRAHAHLFDSSATIVAQLRQVTAPIASEIPGLRVEVERITFRDALVRSQPVLAERNAAKLLFIDQFGVDNVTDDVFHTLIAAPKCDFLFFLSSDTLYRFRDHKAIKQKIVRPDDRYHAHRAALDYYRGLLPIGSNYHLAPFSIKKGNIYGLIFGSGHPLGMDKFLEVAWKKDGFGGQADFDIDRANCRPSQLMFDLPDFKPTKVIAFERDLEEMLRSGELKDESGVIDLCFRHGVRRQHSQPVLLRLKQEGVVTLDFKVPDIRRLRDPRPIRLLRK